MVFRSYQSKSWTLFRDNYQKCWTEFSFFIRILADFLLLKNWWCDVHIQGFLANIEDISCERANVVFFLVLFRLHFTLLFLLKFSDLVVFLEGLSHKNFGLTIFNNLDRAPHTHRFLLDFLGRFWHKNPFLSRKYFHNLWGIWHKINKFFENFYKNIFSFSVLSV